MKDVVYLYGYKDEDSNAKHIGKGVIQNIANEILHGIFFGKLYVSLKMTESYQDDYPLRSIYMTSQICKYVIFIPHKKISFLGM